MTASDDHSPLTNIGARPDPHTPGDATGPHVTRDCGQHIWPSLCGFLAGLCLLLTIISIQFVDLAAANTEIRVPAPASGFCHTNADTLIGPGSSSPGLPDAEGGTSAPAQRSAGVPPTGTAAP